MIIIRVRSFTKTSESKNRWYLLSEVVLSDSDNISDWNK
jgi:hypothetical protein